MHILADKFRCLELTSQVLDPAAVNPQVEIAPSGCRTDTDHFSLWIEFQLHVIDKTKNATF